jgi:hypothetical protein
MSIPIICIRTIGIAAIEKEEEETNSAYQGKMLQV